MKSSKSTVNKKTISSWEEDVKFINLPKEIIQMVTKNMRKCSTTSTIIHTLWLKTNKKQNRLENYW